MEKYRSIIENITLGGPVFQNESFQPAQINFFYGKNGSGKTTAAYQICDPEHAQFRNGSYPGNYEFLLYDEAFVNQNVRNYANMPGVFTISEGDAENRIKLDRMNEELVRARQESAGLKKEIEEVDERITSYRDSIKDIVWRETADIRKMFPAALTGFKTKSKFFDKLVKTRAQGNSIDRIAEIYKAAYNGDGKKYNYYNTPQTGNIPSTPLLAKRIISSGSTPFAEFVNTLSGLTWIRNGHDQFHAKAGDRCPYCQQKLPDTFEADLASCYDKKYKEDMDCLDLFLEEYIRTLNRIYKAFQSNLSSGFQCGQTESYKDKLDLFFQTGTNNIRKIREKIADPVQIVELKDLDGLKEELVKLTRDINDKIVSNNKAADNISGLQNTCKSMLWEKLAFECRGILSEFNERMSILKQNRTAKGNRAGQINDRIKKYAAEIAELNTRTTNTTLVMERINRVLKDNGFQGFHLQEKEDVKFVYRLERDDGEVAMGLSDGEKRVLAFLYFYHLVTGSRSDDGVIKDKVVVIDDPASGMDPGSMALIARLVRNLISMCRNTQEMYGGLRGNRIAQIFCLTHNPDFLRAASYGFAADYERVSVFEIKKGKGNRSRVTVCEQRVNADGDMENLIPVKNHYEGLWTEIKLSEDPAAAANAMREIVEYYFLRICGYEGLAEVRSCVAAYRERAGIGEEGILNLADMFLSAAEADYDNPYGRTGIGAVMSADEARRTLKMIFKAMGAERHYKLMMTEDI